MEAAACRLICGPLAVPAAAAATSRRSYGFGHLNYPGSVNYELTAAAVPFGFAGGRVTVVPADV